MNMEILITLKSVIFRFLDSYFFIPLNKGHIIYIYTHIHRLTFCILGGYETVPAQKNIMYLHVLDKVMR
jgi:hypothetical protein